MVEFTTHVDIGRGVEDVYQFVADFENTPRWNYFVVDVTKRSAGPHRVGTLFHQVRKTDEQDYEITALDPDRSIEIKTTATSSPSFAIRYEFEAMGSATRVSDHWRLETGRNTLLERLAARQIRTAVAENLGKLKELLETGTAELQDGRLSKLPSFETLRSAGPRAGGSGTWWP